MNPIKGIDYRIVPAEFEDDGRLVFVSIRHDHQNGQYDIEIRTDDQTPYSIVKTTNSKYDFFFLSDEVNKFKIKVTCTSDPLFQVVGETPYIFTTIPGSFVTVVGQLLTVEGEPASGAIIEFNLRPTNVSHEFSGSLVCPEIEGMVETDDMGFFSLNLAANKSTDPTKRMAYPNTWYEFIYFGNMVEREIDYDNGTTQQFFTLLPPEKKRIRSDNYWAFRNNT